MRTYHAWNVTIGHRTWASVVAPTAQSAVLSVVGATQGTPGTEKAEIIECRRALDVDIPDCAFDLVQASADCDPDESMTYLRESEQI